MVRLGGVRGEASIPTWRIAQSGLEYRVVGGSGVRASLRVPVGDFQILSSSQFARHGARAAFMVRLGGVRGEESMVGRALKGG